MSQSEPVEELSVTKLFDNKTQYVIPIYQRNYAWGAPEIEQLIQDIYDASGKGVSETQQDLYYLGSLVVYTRNEKANNQQAVYETIDGQQRHTTLSILLAYLKSLKVADLDELQVNLRFDSRPKSTRALEDIYLNDANGGSEEPNIHAAYDIIKRYFKIKGLDKANKARAFCDYLLNKVTILRVTVPQDTDLNHYFEIMNNRGEQLEKHEVLKAKFMSVLKDDEKARDCFSVIWDACADMKRYVQMGFKSEVRKTVFGDDWRAVPIGFESIQQHIEGKEPSQGVLTLREIIKQKASQAVNDDAREKEERFGSIIDFSNFLLHVLKLTIKNDNVSLDDKKLLDAFITKEGLLTVDPKEFAFSLLTFRILFDKYIIKREYGDKWSLQTLVANTSGASTSPSYQNSFGKEQDNALNEKLRMILAMFHVSNPAPVYKRWLNDALKQLASLTSEQRELIVSGDDYLSELEILSDHYYVEIVGDNGHIYPDGILHQGTGVQNFIFNRLDYLLWRKLSAGDMVACDMVAGKGTADLEEHFNKFQFSFRTSVEHYFPQTDPSGASAKARGMENVDRFGNLCLISPSSNSRLNNYSPADKKLFYRENHRAESLKQAIMMSYDDWGPEGQGLKNIEKHESLMLEVLSGRKV